MPIEKEAIPYLRHRSKLDCVVAQVNRATDKGGILYVKTLMCASRKRDVPEDGTKMLNRAVNQGEIMHENVEEMKTLTCASHKRAVPEGGILCVKTLTCASHKRAVPEGGILYVKTLTCASHKRAVPDKNTAPDEN